MVRIVLVGAGSVEFTRNLLGDILAYPELQGATTVLDGWVARSASSWCASSS